MCDPTDMSVVKQFFVTSLLLSAWAAAEVAPQNEVAVAGRDVTLQCGSDNDVFLQWKHRQLSGEDTWLTYERNIISDHRRLMLSTTIDGQYDLHISQVERSDAGTYICIKTEASTADNRSVVSKRYEAQLVVLTYVPNCTLNKITGNRTLLENDYVQMQCHVRYVGNLVPVMEWRREGQLMDAAQINTTAGNQIFRSSLLVQVNSSDNGVRFLCDVFFAPIIYNESSDGLLFRANNTPEYKYRWTSSQMDVSSIGANQQPNGAYKPINNDVENTTINETECAPTVGCSAASDSKGIILVILAITNTISMTACIVLIIRYKKAKGTTSAATDPALPATISTSEYAELHDHATNLPTYINVNLHESGYTDLNVSRSRSENPVVYTSLHLTV